MTRLILANGQGTYAQMQLGNTLIRLVPSMSTIYAYEDYADSCAKAANRGPAKPGKQSDKPGKSTQKSKLGIQS